MIFMKKFIILALILFSLAFASCNGQASAAVPAVIGEQDGGVVNFDVKLIDGTGNIYLTTFPETGVSTQISADQAVSSGFLTAGKDISQCDVLIRIYGKEISNYVEGPSAGNAMGVLTYAAITNNPVRADSTITGAIDDYGNILPVGGLFEKAKATAKLGYKYIVTPVNRFAERLILNQIESNYGLKVVEVANLSESVDFLVNGKEIPKKDFKAMIKQPITVPDFTDYDNLGQFKKIASDIINLENQSIQKLDSSVDDIKEIRKYFEIDIEQQNNLLQQGYLFSAANGAFLSYIDVSTILNVNSLDLSSKADQIKSCLNQLPEVKKTKNNYELVIGSDLRREWSTQKLSNSDVSKPHLTEEKYVIFNDLMYADTWCFISDKMIKYSDQSEAEVVDESKWKDLASSKIREVELLNSTSSEWIERLNNAKSLFKQGKYGASIYDAVFAEGMITADLSIENSNIDSKNEELSKSKRSSYWGRVYQTQGVYLYLQGDKVGAYRVLKYAQSLDVVDAEMQTLLKELPTQNNPQQEDVGIVTTVLIALSGILALIVISFIFLKMTKLKSKKF